MCVVIKRAFANIVEPGSWARSPGSTPEELTKFKEVLGALVRDTMGFPAGRTYQTAKFTCELVACALNILIGQAPLQVCLETVKCCGSLIDAAIQELLGEDFLKAAEELVNVLLEDFLPRVEQACVEIAKVVAAQFPTESIPEDLEDFKRILAEVPADADLDALARLVAAVQSGFDKFAELQGSIPDIDAIVADWCPVEALQKLTSAQEQIKFAANDEKATDAIALFRSKVPSGFSAALEAEDFKNLSSSVEPGHWAIIPEAFVACRNEVKPLLNGKILSKAAQTAVNEFLTESGPGVLAIMACIQTVQAGNLSKKAMLAKVVVRG